MLHVLWYSDTLMFCRWWVWWRDIVCIIGSWWLSSWWR